MSTFTNVNVHFFTRPYLPAPSRVWHNMLRLSQNPPFIPTVKLCIYDHFILLEKFRFSPSKHRAKILSYNMLGLRKNPPFFSNTFSLLSVSEKRALSAITLPVADPSKPSEPCDLIPSEPSESGLKSACVFFCLFHLQPEPHGTTYRCSSLLSSCYAPRSPAARSLATGHRAWKYIIFSPSSPSACYCHISFT